MKKPGYDESLRFMRGFLAPYVQASEEEVHFLATLLEPLSVEAGAVLFSSEVPCRELILLSSGLVRTYYLHEAREVNLRLLCGPAVVTAMSSVITGAPPLETVAAITDIQGFRMGLQEEIEPSRALLMERLRRILAEQHYLALERRLQMLQWKSGAERYAFFCRHMDPYIVSQTPGYHVASYLGVAPETLSRLRSRRR